MPRPFAISNLRATMVRPSLEEPDDKSSKSKQVTTVTTVTTVTKIQYVSQQAYSMEIERAPWEQSETYVERAAWEKMPD